MQSEHFPQAPSAPQAFAAEALRLAIAHDEDGLKALALCDDAACEVLRVEQEKARPSLHAALLLCGCFAAAFAIFCGIFGASSIFVWLGPAGLFCSVLALFCVLLMSAYFVAQHGEEREHARAERAHVAALYAAAIAIRASIDAASIAASEVRLVTGPPPVPPRAPKPSEPDPSSDPS